MLQASEALSPESVTTQETSFRELAHWAIGIVRRQFLVIALFAAVGTSLGALLRPHGAAHLYSRSHG